MGVLLCLVSAAGFGAMAIFGKLAYDAEVSTLTLLLVRFAAAGTVFGVVIGARRELRARRPEGRGLWIGLGLGAIGYATQAGLFFAALHRLDASLLALLLYTYPAWVVLAAFALGRAPDAAPPGRARRVVGRPRGGAGGRGRRRLRLPGRGDGGGGRAGL